MFVPKVTKKKEPDKPGIWRIYIDGKRTRLYVQKGPAPKYRMPQEWDAYSDTDPNFALCTQNGLDAVISAVTEMTNIVMNDTL